MGGEYWIKSRYAGKCSECECDYSEGDRILFVPHDNRRNEVFCEPCGKDVVAEDDEIQIDD